MAVQQLASLSRLHTLVLDGCTAVRRSGLQQLAALPSLTALSLAGCAQLTVDDLPVLAELPVLRSLTLDVCAGLTGAPLTALAACTALRSLSLAVAPWLTDEHASSLRALSMLETLDVSYCKELSATAYVASVGQLRALTALVTASVTHFDDACLSAVASLSRLTRLDMANAERVSSVAVRAHVGRLTALRSLSLARCGAVDDSALVAMQPLVHLTALNLEGCLLVGEEAVRVVAAACDKLQRLNLRHCVRVSDHALQLLATLPPHTLLWLDLSGCHAVTAQGVSYLASHVHLRHLALANAQSVRNNALVYVAKLRELRHLDLRGLALSDDYVAALAALSALRRLWLSNNCALTDRGLDTLPCTPLTALPLPLPLVVPG